MLLNYPNFTLLCHITHKNSGVIVVGVVGVQLFYLTIDFLKSLNVYNVLTNLCWAHYTHLILAPWKVFNRMFGPML